MLAPANGNGSSNDGQPRVPDESVITQYGVPGSGGNGLRQSQRQSSWSSLLCCVRPPGEECVPLTCPTPAYLFTCTALSLRSRRIRGPQRREGTG
jgi:hypothetical protein